MDARTFQWLLVNCMCAVLNSLIFMHFSHINGLFHDSKHKIMPKLQGKN